LLWAFQCFAVSNTTCPRIFSKGKLKMLYFRNIGYESRPIGFCRFVSLQQLSNY
jgi:hypothetical protein